MQLFWSTLKLQMALRHSAMHPSQRRFHETLDMGGNIRVYLLYGQVVVRFSLQDLRKYKN